MNFRLTAIFFVAVVVLVGGLMVAVWTADDPTAAGTGTGLVPALTNAGVKPADVDTVEIRREGEGELVLVRTADGRWKLEKPTSAPVDGFLVDNLIRDLFQADPVDYAGRTNNPAVHGLQDPTVRITLKSGADKSATVNIGDTTIGGADAMTYVATGDRPDRPLAVPRANLAGLFPDTAGPANGSALELTRGLSDFRLNKPLGADVRDPATDVRLIKLSDGGKDLALARAPDGSWTFATPADFGEADVGGDTVPNADVFTGVRPLLNALTSPRVAGADSYIEQPGDLAQYGLAPSDPAVRIELQSTAGPAEVLFLGKPVEADGKPVTPPAVYARLDGDSAVMKLPFDRMAMLKATIANPSELRNKDLFPVDTRSRITAIDAIIGGSTVKLRKVPTPDGGPTTQWVLYGAGEPLVADQETVDELITALTQPRLAMDVLTSPDDAAFAEPERKATIKLWTSGFERTPMAEGGKLPAEPTPLGTPTELVFGKRDADSVFVRRSGLRGSTDFKLPDRLITLATQPRLAYVDPKIKSFVVNEVTKLRYNRGPEMFEVVKASEPDPLYPNGKWTFTEPATLAGKLADSGKVDEVLGGLSRLQPERVVADQPSAEELKTRGLHPTGPKTTIAVTLTDDDPVTYAFGEPTDNGSAVFARQNDGPVVFTVPKAAVDAVVDADIADKTVFRLDPNQVRMVKLRGWKALTGTPLTYQFRKANSVWTADSPPTPAGFTPDPAKLNGLVMALSAPKAVSVIGAGKLEHGTSVDKNADALEVTVERADGPTVTLVLGGPAGPDVVYAASSARPGETFTVNPTEIKKFTDKPASLQK